MLAIIDNAVGDVEKAGSREENYRGITPDEERAQLSTPLAREKEAEYNVKPGVNRTEKNSYW